MKQHSYRITVEHILDAKGVPSTYDAPLQFNIGNHDDIFEIVERLRRRTDFDPNTSTALAIGLKLFSEVMLENRGNPLFEDLTPHISSFMKKLKSTTP